jgi:hypothetical protein
MTHFERGLLLYKTLKQLDTAQTIWMLRGASEALSQEYEEMSEDLTQTLLGG